MATVSSTYISPEEYLRRERSAIFRSEYLRGQVFAMAGATRRHARIVGNLARYLGNKLAGRDCEVFSTDLKLSVPSLELYAYPDVMVLCGEPTLREDLEDTVTKPTVVIEVLSKSTQNFDRGEKFEYYRTLASLQEYVTVAQDRLHLEHHVRQASGQWLMTKLTDPASVLTLASLGVQLPLAEIYERVAFPDPTS